MTGNQPLKGYAGGTALSRAARTGFIRLLLSAGLTAGGAYAGPPEPMLWPSAIPTASAVSLDGKTLAIGGQDGNIRLFRFKGKSAAMASVNCGNRAAELLALSPDGGTLAASGGAGWLAVYDAATGAKKAEVPAGTAKLTRILFSDDGKTLAAAAGGEVRLLSAGDGRNLGKFKTSGAPDLALARSRDWLKYAASKADLALLPPEQEKWLKSMAERGKVWLSPGGKIMAHGYGPELRRVPGGEEVKLEKLPGEHAQFLAFGAGGDKIAVLREYGDVQAWDLKTGRLTAAFNWRENNDMLDQRNSMLKRPRGFYFVDGARLLCIVSEAGTAELWDPATGKKVRTLAPNTAAVSALAVTPGGRRLLSADWTGAVTLWDLEKGGVLRRWPSVTEGWPASLAVSPDGKTFLYAEGGLTFGALRQLAGGGPSADFGGRRQRLMQQRSGKYAVVRNPFNPAETLLLSSAAASGADMAAVIKAALRLQDAAPSDYGMDLAPGGRYMAYGMRDGAVGLVDLEAGTVKKIPGGGSYAWAVAYSTDGKYLAVSDVAGVVNVWETAGWTSVARLGGFSGYGYNRAPLSPDGRLAVAPDLPPESRALLARGIGPDRAATPSFRLVDNRTKKETVIREPGEPVMFFSPDSSALAALRDLGGIKVWETASARALAELQAPAAKQYSAGFWPGNKYLFAGGADGVIRLYDLASGRQALAITGFLDGEWLFALPGGRYKASPGAAKYLKTPGPGRKAALAEYASAAQVEAALGALP